MPQVAQAPGIRWLRCPAACGSAPSLQTLALASPGPLAGLTAITCLTLGVTSLTGPQQWCQLLQDLPALRSLDVSIGGEADTEALAAALPAATSLTSLEMLQRRYDSWAHLLPLTQLQQLSLANCGLSAVPPEVGALSQLTWLELDFNRLQGGWEVLARLPRLAHLRLICCDLAEVPGELAGLPALVAVDLDANVGCSPSSLANLPRRLEGLSFPVHDLEEVREGRWWRAIHELLSRLCDQGIQPNVWDGREPALAWHGTDVYQRACHRTNMPTCLPVCPQVPEGISQLQTLTRLGLVGDRDLPRTYHLHGGWERLRPLAALQDLDLSYTALQEVPAVLTTLSALTRLALRGNPLRRGLRRLGTLTRLRDLDLTDCGLHAPPMVVRSLTALTCLWGFR